MFLISMMAPHGWVTRFYSLGNRVLNKYNTYVYKSCTVTNYCFYGSNANRRGLVLGVYTAKVENGREVCDLTDSFKEIDEKCNRKLTSALQATGPFYKTVNQKLLWVSLLKELQINLDFECISVVDLGSKTVEEPSNTLEDLDEKAEKVRCALAVGVKALRSCSDFEEIYLDPCDNPQSVAEGAKLALYCYDVLKKQSTLRTKSNLHLYKYAQIPKEKVESFERGMILAESQNFSRTLMETPANLLTPTIFADTVNEKFKDSNVKVITRDNDWIKSMKMESFLSVAKGSEESPKFVELHYVGEPKVDKCIAFVGKGITFDSGGISLKPSQNMDKMRADMGGAACVAASILAASKLKLKVNVKGFIPLAENLLSGKANKPGDVVTAMNGKTIQVDNTDCEGRLILCDGLCYAQQFKPMFVLDIATLTGAVVVALGRGASAVYSNNEELWKTIHKAGQLTGDRVWRMPLFKMYNKFSTDCHLADINNTPAHKGEAGSCAAATFLQEFIDGDTKWLHIDMAGVMETKGEYPYFCPGMSGRPTRTLVQFLKELEAQF